MVPTLILLVPLRDALFNAANAVGQSADETKKPLRDLSPDVIKTTHIGLFFYMDKCVDNYSAMYILVPTCLR